MIGFLLPLLFALTPLLALKGGAWTYSTVIIAFVLLPILDLLIPKAESKPVSGPRWYFNGVLFLFAIYHPMMVIGFSSIMGGDAGTEIEIIGITLSCGIISGLGITFAHELVHRRNRFEKFMGELILVFVCYGHFAVAHVLGHHRNVGTPMDPATARKNQSIYSFYLQSLIGVYKEALHLRRKQTLIYSAISLSIAAVLYFVFGLKALLFFIAQSLVAALLLETIDYIEHYGLVRKETAPNRFEGVKAEHSWDSQAWLTGKILIHLQRHADHHLHVLKEYPTLELPPTARQLPTGYAGMLLLALIPPLWFRVMNPRV